MKNKQTAVEWLFKQIYGETNYINSYTTDGKDAFEAFEKAKEMEKQQIIDAYDAGLFDGSMDDINDRMHKQYYNETYGK